MPRGASADRLIPLLFGLLGPPLFWGLRISASYVMTPLACELGGVLILHGVAGAALVGTTAAGLVAYRAWGGLSGRRAREGTGSGGAPTERSRFIALIGLLGAGFFFAVIAAESLANFLVDPCLTGGAPL